MSVTFIVRKWHWFANLQQVSCVQTSLMVANNSPIMIRILYSAKSGGGKLGLIRQITCHLCVCNQNLSLFLRNARIPDIINNNSGLCFTLKLPDHLAMARVLSRRCLLIGGYKCQPILHSVEWHEAITATAD